ncbi:MAG: hypothetical protein AAB875_04600 [Patescibacteria group bacterium]
MKTITYRPIQSRSVPSPFQSTRGKAFSAFNVQDERHPARKEVLKTIGSYNFTAEIQEDAQALALFNRPGLIAFVCTLKRNKGGENEVLGQGRGVAILNKLNRYVEKTIQAAASAALVDAVVKSTKVLDTLGIEMAVPAKPYVPVGEAYQAKPDESSDGATPKQIEYLRQLIALNIFDDEERNRWEDQISSLTREDASEAIQKFVRSR